MRVASTMLGAALLLAASTPGVSGGEAPPAASRSAPPEAARSEIAPAPGEPSDHAACIESTVAAIQRRYGAVRDLRSRFVQETRSVALGGPGAVSVSSGTVTFAKPGRMRWSYEEPEPSLLVSDGRWLWIYDPANREAQRFAVADGYLSGAAIQFLLGEGDIPRDFRVSAESCAGEVIDLELVPREAATYEKLRVRVDRNSGELLETTLVDLLGNVTRVAFHETQVNLDPAPELFRFDPPPGVRLIEVEPTGAGK